MAAFKSDHVCGTDSKDLDFAREVTGKPHLGQVYTKCDARHQYGMMWYRLDYGKSEDPLPSWLRRTPTTWRAAQTCSRLHVTSKNSGCIVEGLIVLLSTCINQVVTVPA